MASTVVETEEENQTETEVQDSGDSAETVQRCQVGESASTVAETEEENQREAEVQDSGDRAETVQRCQVGGPARSRYRVGDNQTEASSRSVRLWKQS